MRFPICLYEEDGLCDHCVSWLRQCVLSVTFRAKVNGVPLPSFRPTQGIKQEDLLSHYLFIIVGNVLSSLIQKTIGDGSLKGVKLNRGCPTLLHMLLTNDAIFFLDWTVKKSQY